MSFELDTSDVAQSSGGSTTSNVDFDAMNKEVVEILGTQKKAKTVVGYPVGIYDLGLQPRLPFEKVHNPDDEDERASLANGDATLEHHAKYYDDGKWLTDVEIFTKPRKPAKAIALAVDFPQFTVDKGKYFGESNPLPLRFIMCGTWSVQNPDNPEKKMPIVQAPIYLSENTNNDANEWAISNRTTLHKMAEAAELLNDNGNFKASDVSKLLGKPLMFKIQVFMKASKKDASKEYYTESIKFVGEVPEGLPTPEFDNSMIHGVNMNKANDPTAFNQLRAVIKNTMRLSEGWEGSVIKQELEAAKAEKKASTPESKTVEKEPESSAVQQVGSGSDEDYLDDIPF